MKRCCDCYWYEPADYPKPSEQAELAKCDAPENIVAVMADDYKIRRYVYCQELRKAGPLQSRMLNKCGQEARWFTPKEPKP